MLNPDAVPDEAGLHAGIDVLDDEPDVAMVQGVIRNAGTGDPERSAGVELSWFHLLGRATGARHLLDTPLIAGVARRIPHLEDHVDRVRATPADVEALSGVAPLCRRSAIDSVGGFDENYFLYAEDLDLSVRLRKSGWRLVTLPVEWATHVEGASSGSWWFRERNWWEGTMRFAALHWNRTGFCFAMGAATLQWIRMVVDRPRDWRRAARALLVNPLHLRRQIGTQRR